MILEPLLEQEVQNLSGGECAVPRVVVACVDVTHAACIPGELQRVAIVLALGHPADIYLIDEPSAYAITCVCA
jgi:translation initiation factor RLI1